MNGRNGNGNGNAHGPTTTMNGHSNGSNGGREPPVRALPLGPRALVQNEGHNNMGDVQESNAESNKPGPGEQISANGGYEKVEVSLPRASTPPTRNYAPDSGLGAAGRVEEAHLSTASTARFVERKDTSNARFSSPHTREPLHQHGPAPAVTGDRDVRDAAYKPYNVAALHQHGPAPVTGDRNGHEATYKSYNVAAIVPSGPSTGPRKDPASNYNTALLQNQLKDGERFWQLHNAHAQRHDAPTPTVPLQSKGERIQQVFQQLNAPFRPGIRDIVPK